MNDSVYLCMEGSCNTAEANSGCQTTKITYFQTLNLTDMNCSAISVYWAFSVLFLFYESLYLSVHLSQSTQA